MFLRTSNAPTSLSAAARVVEDPLLVVVSIYTLCRYVCNLYDFVVSHTSEYSLLGVQASENICRMVERC